MVLKFYGTTGSTSAQRAQLILHELNIPYELINVDLGKGEHQSLEFKEKSPFGFVPYIVR
jgi:glutathione S-transferase